MKEFLKLLSFFLILSQSVYAQNFKIEKILDLKDPWSLTFVNKDEVLITEKDGEIVFANIKSKDVRKVKHNLNYKVDGQGGLLDILKYNNDIFICYTEDRGGGKTSTSIAKATFTKDNLNFKNIFQANPPI
ncbi:MAG: PQQ-dependent sugar dehydrogenase, partial [Proteobacteria bacterium]|nr:PQQ-dependent sugar dehydrogenase [Pseudomonadota bacterium]NCX36457.1 PQQ-dependent sugar dehydrogenase [Actinomycetota bacterium]